MTGLRIASLKAIWPAAAMLPGGWYPVVDMTIDDAVVLVNGAPCMVPLQCVVVSENGRMEASWGFSVATGTRPTAVCPRGHHNPEVLPSMSEFRCSGCQADYAIAPWHHGSAGWEA